MESFDKSDSIHFNCNSIVDSGDKNKNSLIFKQSLNNIKSSGYFNYNDSSFSNHDSDQK